MTSQEARMTSQEERGTTEDEQVQSTPATQVETNPAHEVGLSNEDTASSSDPLFSGGELSGLRSRWDEVQSVFVDDPRQSVQKADGLVSDVIDQLTTGFAGTRTRLEEQWARGEEASTEDLRLALKRYREFFQRLLAV